MGANSEHKTCLSADGILRLLDLLYLNRGDVIIRNHGKTFKNRVSRSMVSCDESREKKRRFFFSDKDRELFMEVLGECSRFFY